MRDKDFFKFRRAFFRGHGYHRQVRWLGENSKTPYFAFTCSCGWKGSKLEDHFKQIKPQRDIYNYLL